jgi:hypothetical protein
MKWIFALSIMVATAMLLTLGVFAMDMHGESRISCIAQAARGIACPENAGPIAFIAFHFDAFKDLAASGAGIFGIAALWLIFALIYLLRQELFGFAAIQIVFEPQRFVILPQKFTPPLILTLRLWLARHEISPSYAYWHSE